MRTNLAGPFNSGAGTGGAGLATANATSSTVLSGLIAAVYVRYNDSPPAASTDVTIATAGNGAPAYNILVLTNAATNGLFLVRGDGCDTAGTALTTDAEFIPIHDNVKVTIAGANDGDSADVWLLLRE